MEVAPKADTNNKRSAATCVDDAKKDVTSRDAKKAKGVAGANGVPRATHTVV